MRFWIIALLVLQFFGSAGIGSLDQERGSHLDAATLTSEAESRADASVLDLEHDLLDEIPDLPDALDPWPAELMHRSPWGRNPPHRNPHSPLPSLEGLQRPPQA